MEALARQTEYERPWLADYQREAIFGPERFALIEASTKSGKTIGCEIWLLELALAGERGQEFLWGAPSIFQAKIAFDGEKGLTTLLAREATDFYLACLVNLTERTLTLPHGSVIRFVTLEEPDKIYGPAYHGFVIDEASRVREAAWHAVRTTITQTKAPGRMIGNVKGRANWFYKWCRRAEAGEHDSAFHRITYQDAVEAGILDSEEVENARRDLPEKVFQELYEAIASDDEGNPFESEYRDSCIGPLSNLEPVAWGWDLAKSVDWTVGIGLDRHARVCRFVRYQKPWRETKRDIRKQTGDVKALVDSTGVGDPVVEDLQRDGGSNFEGFKFTQPSKQQLMEGLVKAIENRDIRYPDGPIVRELESFEYEYTRTGVHYSAPQGMHDDCVMALALAWKHFVKLFKPNLAHWGVVADD